MEEEKKEIMKYFLGNIFEAKNAYEAWKMIYGARLIPVVGKELAENYVKVQNYHSAFFISTERAFLITFVILICHAFDRNPASFSLDKVDQEECFKFFEENKIIIEQLKTVRNKVFAHREIGVNPEEKLLPSIENLDSFFIKLESLYNVISRKVDNSVAIFDATDLKNNIEYLYMNLERGETTRLKEIDIEWLWEKSDNRISKKI